MTDNADNTHLCIEQDTMILSLIVAMDENHGIGKDGHLPWKLSADLQRFKTLTSGHHIIMGRKTYASIGRLLPNRTTVIITRNSTFQVEGGLVVTSLPKALAVVRERGETEAFIIGGGEIYKQSIGLADRMYLTLVHTVADTDTLFPEFDQGDWVIKESITHPADERNTFPSTYYLLEKKSSIFILDNAIL